jgi:hypothetical protein
MTLTLLQQGYVVACFGVFLYMAGEVFDWLTRQAEKQRGEQRMVVYTLWEDSHGEDSLRGIYGWRADADAEAERLNRPKHGPFRFINIMLSDAGRKHYETYWPTQARYRVEPWELE